MSGAVVGWSVAVVVFTAATVFLVLLAWHGRRVKDPRGDTELWTAGMRVSDGFRQGAKRAGPVFWLGGLGFVAASLVGLFEAIGGGAARLVVPMALAAAALMAS